MQENVSYRVNFKAIEDETSKYVREMREANEARQRADTHQAVMNLQKETPAASARNNSYQESRNQLSENENKGQWLYF